MAIPEPEQSQPASLIDPTASVADDARIGPLAIVEARVRVGERTTIGAGTIVEQGCQLGNGCTIGYHVVLHAGTRLGAGCVVRDGAVLGRAPRVEPNLTQTTDLDQAPVHLGAGCQIGANAVVYAGAVFGDEVSLGDLASVREDCTVGAHSTIGRAVLIEYGCQIGQRVRIHAGCYITGETTIEEGAILGPAVAMANDKFMDRLKLPEMRGPWIGRGARIGSNVTLLPGIRLGDDCAIGAGVVVTKDVPPGTIVTGLPSRPRTPARPTQPNTGSRPD